MMTKYYEDDKEIKYKIDGNGIRTIMNESGVIESIEFDGKTYRVGVNVGRIEVVDPENNENLKFGWRASTVRNPTFLMTFRKRR
jgi:hypothetical protein